MDQQVAVVSQSLAEEHNVKTVCQTKSKPSYKHVPHSQKPAHLVAKRNARERRRVQAVNQAFYRLRKCVPIENRNKRVSKVKTLLRAIDYIRKLERILADDDADHEGSEQQQSASHLPLEGAPPTSGSSSIGPEVAGHRIQERKEERRLKRGSLDSSARSRKSCVTTRTGREQPSSKQPRNGRSNQLSAGELPAQHHSATTQAQAQAQALAQDQVLQEVQTHNNCHQAQQAIYPHQHHQTTILRDSSYHTNPNHYYERQCCNQPSYMDMSPAPPVGLQGPAEHQHLMSSHHYLASAAGYYTPDNDAAAAASSSPHIGLSSSSSAAAAASSTVPSIYAPADSTTGSLYSLEVAAAPLPVSSTSSLQQLSALTVRSCPVPGQEAASKQQQQQQHHQIPGGGAPALTLLQSPGSCSSATVADSPSGDNSSTTATARRPPAAASIQQQQQQQHQAPHPLHHQQQQQVNAGHHYLAYAAEARAVHLSFAVINDNNNGYPPTTRQQPDGGASLSKSNRVRDDGPPPPHHQVVGLRAEQHAANSFQQQQPVYLQNQQQPPHHHQPATNNMQCQQLLHHHHEPQPQPQPQPHHQPPSFLNNQHVQAAANHLSAPHLGPAPGLLPLQHGPMPATIQEYTG